jgi:HlyD family secretion protein
MRNILFLFSKISIFLAFLGLLLAVIFIQFFQREPPANIPIAMPAVNPYSNAIVASGIVEANGRNIAVGAPQSGLVEALYVKVGDEVNKGDILFKIDSRNLRGQLLVQQSSVDVAEATLKRLQDQLERLKSVQDPRAVSGEEVKTRQNDVSVARAQVRAAKAQVRETLMLISRLSVKAPREGLILQNNIREGEYVTAGSSPPPILLGDVEKLEVRADIDEQNASRFKADSKAFAFPKNNSELKIPLKFDRIEPYVLPKHSLTGASDERVDTRVLQVIYSFDMPENFQVYVGQQVDVFIEESQAVKKPVEVRP